MPLLCLSLGTQPALILVNRLVVLSQRVAELAAAIATGNKIQRLTLRGLNCSHQSRLTRHGNGRWGQAGASVGIPGVVRTQIASTQIAIEGRTHAVNDRRVCLQGHAQTQAIVKHAGDHGAITGASRFFFYQAGQKDRKSTRLNSSHIPLSRMPSSA